MPKQTMNRYRVRIVATSYKDVEVFATDPDEAGETVLAMWGEGDIQFDICDEFDAEVESVEEVRD